MTKPSGKNKQRLRLLKGHTAEMHGAKLMSKALALEFIATPSELKQAFKDARERAEKLNAEVAEAKAAGRYIKMED